MENKSKAFELTEIPISSSPQSENERLLQIKPNAYKTLSIEQIKKLILLKKYINFYYFTI